VYLHREELIKKILAWKVCSMAMTLTTLWVYTGSATDAALLTFILHSMFIFTHRVFEISWEKKSRDDV